MSRERARRREERERQAAEVAAVRAAQLEREQRRRARRDRLTGWIPRSRPLPGGRLAERRRTEWRATLALVLAFNVLLWVFDHDWAARALALVVSVLATPLLHLLIRRNP